MRGVWFTRKDIVLNVCNTDGGAHVDPGLAADYHALSRENSIGWSVGCAGKDTPLANPEYAAVRQIAYELQMSLKDHIGG